MMNQTMEVLQWILTHTK